MSEPGPSPVRSVDSPPEGGPYGWRRRRLVVDARFQLRAGVLVGSVAMVLLVLLNVSLYLQRRSTTGGAAAVVRPLFAGQDRSTWMLLLAGSAVFLVGVFLIGVLESHRTAGASFAIRRAVDAIRDGKPQVRIHLRRGDHLQDLARSVNQLASTLDAERLRRS